MKANNKKHIIGWACCAALALSGLASCNTPQRLVMAEQEDIVRFRHSGCRGGGAGGFLPVVLQDSVRGGDLTVSRHWVTGEHAKSLDFGRVNIVSQSYVVGERNGTINIGFLIRIPKELAEQDWKVKIVPMLDNRGKLTTLKPVVIRGHVNNNYYNRLDSADRRRLRGNARLHRQLQDRRDFFRGRDQRVRAAEAAADSLEAWDGNKRLRLLGLKHDAVNGHAVYEYYYCQQVDVTDVKDELRVYFTARLENMARRRYYMQTRDTLVYRITSLAEFCDPGLQWRRDPADTLLDDRYSTRIMFRQGQSAFDRGLEGNSGNLRALVDHIRSSVSRTDLDLQKVTVTAACSPEGPASFNDRLGKARAETVCGLLRRSFPNIRFESGSRSENWEGLAEAVRAMDLERGGEMLRVIRAADDADEREALLAQGFPEQYRRLYAEVYPSLRRVIVDCHFLRKESAAVPEREAVPGYSEALGHMEARRYHEALAILEPYRDWNTAVCYLCLGRNAEARDLLAAFPASAEQLYLLSIANERLGNKDEAFEQLMRSCSLDESFKLRRPLDCEADRLGNMYNVK